MLKSAVLLLAASAAFAILAPATSPPMGWRSWNSLMLNVNDTAILAQAAVLAGKGPNGGKSLLESGYVEVGVDDGWQDPSGVDGSFHDSAGNPLINKARFPDLPGMVQKAKAMGVNIGWYHNNCYDSGNEKKAWAGTPPNGGNVDKDVALIVNAGITGLKIDGCGPAHNITVWGEAIAAAPYNITVENCGDNHLTWTPPDVSTVSGHCPFSLYRVSSDIAPQFLSTMYNLQQRALYTDAIHPGCWAYPDMSQVGNTVCNSKYCGGLSVLESRTHFAAWCVSSAPIVLGFDMTNKTAYDSVYPIISNAAAISINQAWNGDPGHVVANSTTSFDAHCLHGAGATRGDTYSLPTWQVWAKKLDNGKVAALFINLSDSPVTASVSAASLGISGSKANLMDVWSGNSLGSSSSFAVTSLAAHDSVFVIASAA